MSRKCRVHSQSNTNPRIVGVSVELPDGEEVYRRAVADWQKTQQQIRRKSDQRIEFARGPICIVFMADLHLGSSGVDYERLFREAEIVAETDGMYLMLVGDLMDNFIVEKLVHARHDSHIPIQEEWALVRRFLQVVGKKLLVSVRGNHERWTWVLAGIDYFADVLKSVNGRAIYDSDDVVVTLQVGTANFPMRLRHQWIGRSIYNLTHGIERAERFDGNFIVGVGAHHHASGVVRTFNARGANGMAVMCGSYKTFDPFARERGLPRANTSAAMAVLFFEDGAMVGVDRLAKAAELIAAVRG